MVNGEYIFLDEYERQVAHYEAALLEQGLDADAEGGQADLARVREEILEGLIDQVLIEQGAEALGVVVTDEELEAQLEKDIAAGQGQAAFDQWLQVTGLDRDEYRRMVGEALLTQRLLERAAADLPAEMEQVHIRSIVVDSERAAQEIRDLVAEGADFGELAKERSQDLATVDPGGDMGWFPRGLLDPAMEGVAFGLAAGELDVLRLGAEFHIVQVLEKEAARPLSPEARIQLALAGFELWLDDVRQAAVIERFVGE
jgi:foldase protein PrsA